mmetsp:Transcript_42281/g.132456  ORF Transcript_42281/g.132456 Transcript_42281/m.132456 type:complete len:139 (-) Transcript_42281:14-430(-)
MDAGAAARIVAAMEAHVGDAAVALQGCTAIANLAADGSDGLREQLASSCDTRCMQLMDAGAAASIVTAMDAHVGHAGVAKSGFLAIGILARGGNHGVREQLMDAGAAARIVAAMACTGPRPQTPNPKPKPKLIPEPES